MHDAPIKAEPLKVDDEVWVDEMPKGSPFAKISGHVTSIKNDSVSIKTMSVKSRYGQEWKAHECVVDVPLDRCTAVPF